MDINGLGYDMEGAFMLYLRSAYFYSGGSGEGNTVEEGSEGDADADGDLPPVIFALSFAESVADGRIQTRPIREKVPAMAQDDARVFVIIVFGRRLARFIIIGGTPAHPKRHGSLVEFAGELGRYGKILDEIILG